MLQARLTASAVFYYSFEVSKVSESFAWKYTHVFLYLFSRSTLFVMGHLKGDIAVNTPAFYNGHLTQSCNKTDFIEPMLLFFQLTPMWNIQYFSIRIESDTVAGPVYSSVRKEWNLHLWINNGSLIMEIYLRNTQKQLKITRYGRIKSFLELYLVYNGVGLKLLGSLS